MNNKIKFKIEKLIIFTGNYNESVQIYELLISKYKFKSVYYDMEKIKVSNNFIDIEIRKFKSIDNLLRKVRCDNIIFTDYVVRNLLHSSDSNVIRIIEHMIVWNNNSNLKNNTFFFEDIDWIYKTLEENYKSEGV